MLARDRKKYRKKLMFSWLGLIAGVLVTGLCISSFFSSMMPGFFVVLSIIFLIAHRYMYQPGGVPVLIYHSVSDEPTWLPWRNEISVGTKTFERHLKKLESMECNVISTRELVEGRKKGKTLKPKSVVIHLDDGYLDNWVAAFPLLKKYGMKATIFVSTDFIEEGNSCRPTIEDVEKGKYNKNELEWKGYLNWSELQAMEKSGYISIECHGTDHGRVFSGPNVEKTITPQNWRELAWVQWSATEGNKCKWFHDKEPQHFSYGTKILENKAALVAPAWKNGVYETEKEHELRVTKSLKDSKNILEQRLMKKILFFCWPHNLKTNKIHKIALDLGFIATTGGSGENRKEEAPDVVSRVHVSDNSLGFPWLWIEALNLELVVRLFEGNYYSYLLLLPINMSRYFFRKCCRQRYNHAQA